jgi:hypothetical protein
MATLKLRRTYPKGGAAYAIDGVRGSIYIQKSMLAGDAPAEIEVPDGVFTPAGEGKPVATSEEKKAKLVEQAQKQEAAAKKAAERARKARERLEKAGIVVPEGGAVAAEPASV